ncbi:MAG: DUF2914 domain-containing protein [Candidatus Paceibacterota bacterium]
MAFQIATGFFERYEKHISSFALVAGFVIDSFTLQRIDLLFENIVLLSYIVIAGTCILFLSLWKEEWLQRPVLGKVHALLLIAMQFAFGGLFSAFLIFYSRSSSLIASAPFLLLLFFILIGNELFKKQYIRLTVQISIFFLVLYSYLIFTIPVLLGQMSWWIFLLSGAISLVLIRVFILLLRLVNPAKMIMAGNMFLPIIIIFVLINGLYFLNIIPPIPLSLKDSGVYHSLTRTQDGSYVVEEETKTFRDYFRMYEQVSLRAGDSLFAFTSIFAPTNFETDIYHVWEQYNRKSEEWEETNRIRLPIVGGRDGGYRTFSVKQNPGMGLWRVSAVTARGQVIGRINISVERVSELPSLEVITK